MSPTVKASLLAAAVAAGVCLALMWRDTEPGAALARHSAVVALAPPQQNAEMPAMAVSPHASPFGVLPAGALVAKEVEAVPGTGVLAAPRPLQFAYPRHSGR